jgi:hypothetical protein
MGNTLGGNHLKGEVSAVLEQPISQHVKNVFTRGMHPLSAEINASASVVHTIRLETHPLSTA